MGTENKQEFGDYFYDLAFSYFAGDENGKQDLEKARDCLKKAAAAGHKEAKGFLTREEYFIPAKLPSGCIQLEPAKNYTNGWAKQILSKESKITFKYVPPGEFTMGFSEKDRNFLKAMPGADPALAAEAPAHRVRHTRGFYISCEPVTQKQWKIPFRARPLKVYAEEQFPGVAPEWRGDDYPKVGVTWDNCQTFCGLLGDGFRLPTEAEWEYAARGAGISKDYRFSGSDNLGLVGWNFYNLPRSRGSYRGAKSWMLSNGLQCNEDWGCWAEKTASLDDERMDVKKGELKKSNGLDIHDMSGNVMEWCSDWYGPYPKGLSADPKGPEKGLERVCRGGGSIAHPSYCMNAARMRCHPDHHSHHLGFRIVFDALEK